MSYDHRSKHSRLGLAWSSAGALALLVAACSNDDSSSSPPPDSGAGHVDAGADTSTPVDSSAPAVDSGSSAAPEAGEAASSVDSGGGASDSSAPVVDSSTPLDAPAETTAPVDAWVEYCGAQTGLAFCNDFDLLSALEPGGSGFDTVANSLAGAVNSLAISPLRSVSAPDSLLVTMVSGGGDAKVARTITKTVAAATYEYDIYIDQLPKAATGTFVSDFQFVDTSGGSDQFGYRVAVFSKADGSFDHVEVQHNAPSLPSTPDTIYTIPFTAGAWHHLAFDVAFSATTTPVDGGPAGQVSFQVYVDHGATPAVDATSASPVVTAAFARISAGIVYAFNGNAKDYVFSFDNVTLKLQ